MNTCIIFKQKKYQRLQNVDTKGYFGAKDGT